MKSDNVKHPWGAVFALLLGFFMIMMDSTIVTVASPQILDALDTDIVGVQWVQSAYLLSLAVPMLVAGRLGDRYGQKNLTVIGLVIFTASSVWCGLSGDIDMLIAARAVQGIGAACISPQAMAIITRIFPPQHRGTPLGLWGAVAGVAMVVGPLLGGVLVDAFSWHAVFFINVPIGAVAITLTMLLVPSLPRHALHLDFVGAVISAFGLVCLIIGLQEGERFSWGHIWGPFYAWGLIALGLGMIVAFVWWEQQTPRDPLVPMRMFRHRNFTLSSSAILVASFATTALPVPLMFFYQIGRGLSPSQAAIILIPMAVVSGLLAPLIGKATSHVDPRRFAIAGPIIMIVAVIVYAILVSPTTPIAWFFVPSAIAGVASACIWGPLSFIASHDLDGTDAGTGSAIYNVMRQLGAVVGSAAITSMMESRLTAEIPGHSQAAPSLLDHPGLITEVVGPFSVAMTESLVLPGSVLVLAVVLALAITKRAAHGPEQRGLPQVAALTHELPAVADWESEARRDSDREPVRAADTDRPSSPRISRLTVSVRRGASRSDPSRGADDGAEGEDDGSHAKLQSRRLRP